jgi:hypothetical protein
MHWVSADVYDRLEDPCIERAGTLEAQKPLHQFTGIHSKRAAAYSPLMKDTVPAALGFALAVAAPGAHSIRAFVDRCESMEAAECAPVQPHPSDLQDSEVNGATPDIPVAGLVRGAYGEIVETGDYATAVARVGMG